MKKIILLMIILILAIPVSLAQIPIINTYVTDKAGVLSSSAKAQLENDLRNLEKQTNGVQYVIYIENGYPKDYSLEEYTLKIAETNKIGKKGNDNGVLLYVAVKDRKYRWEVGYGVESTLNAALLGRVSREYLVPNLKQGDFEKGVVQSVDVTSRILLGSNDQDIVKLKNEDRLQINSKQVIAGIFLALIFLWIIYSLVKSYKIIKTGMRKTIGGSYKDHFYTGAAGGLFSGGFGGFGGGFSGGGGGFGGGGSSGGF